MIAVMSPTAQVLGYLILSLSGLVGLVFVAREAMDGVRRIGGAKALPFAAARACRSFVSCSSDTPQTSERRRCRWPHYGHEDCR